MHYNNSVVFTQTVDIVSGIFRSPVRHPEKNERLIFLCLPKRQEISGGGGGNADSIKGWKKKKTSKTRKGSFH